MKHLSILLATLVFAFGILTSAADLSLRAFESLSQFDAAVGNQQVFLDLDEKLVLRRAKSSNYAKKTMVSVLTMKDKNGRTMKTEKGQTFKELVVRCDLSTLTKQRKLTLASTKNESNKWKIKSAFRIGQFMQQWTLGKSGQPEELLLACTSFERYGDDLEPKPLEFNSRIISRALETAGIRLKTSFRPSPDSLATTEIRNATSALDAAEDANTIQ